MRYCHFVIDQNNPKAMILLQRLEEELSSIGLALRPDKILEYDETDEVLMDKLKVIFAKYPEAINLI